MVLGMRFKRTDAAKLRFLASRVQAGDLGKHTSANVFTQAAMAAETGEPLEVHCDDPMEVVQMAALYTRLGISQPVIEELSGHRRN